MKRLAALVAVLLVGCGDADPAPTPVARGGEQWAQLARGLPDAADPDSPNVCGRGAPKCIDAVTEEMTRRLELLADACDHNAAFALMYLRVTEGVGLVDKRRFDDLRYLNHLDAVFARLYFNAFDNWQAGKTDDVPEAWRIAFEAADRRHAAGLGDMLLGMNAHISRDLPFALLGAGLEAPTGASGEPDFNRVNALLARVQGPMIEEESRRFDPTIGSSTLPLAQSASSTVDQVIARWRTEAWQNAKRMLAADTEGERARIAEEIETAAAGRARLIASVSSNLVVGPGPERRREYCQLQRNA